jgi:hypothetical protein
LVLTNVRFSPLCRLKSDNSATQKNYVLYVALLILGDEHPGAPQWQLGSKCFRQPIVNFKQRIEDFNPSPKSDTEIQLVAPLLDGLLETSPTNKQPLTCMRILNGTYQSLKCRLVGSYIAGLDLHYKARSLKTKTARRRCHYRERLARHHVKLNIRTAENASTAHLKLLEDANSGVDAAFLFGGVSDGKQSPNLLSLGRIAKAPIWIFYRGTEALDRLTQLKGKRVIINPGIPGLLERLLAAHGVTSNNTAIVTKLAPLAIKALKDG